MTKKIKIVLFACLTICLAVFAVAFAACENSTEKFDGSYTVTVVDESGNPVTGVDVQLCEVEEDGSLGLCLMAVPVDENGVAVITRGVKEDVIYHIQINGLNDGLTYGDVYTTAGTYSYTVMVTQE